MITMTGIADIRKYPNPESSGIAKKEETSKNTDTQKRKAPHRESFLLGPEFRPA
jgi:hypothetical protein